MWTVVILEWLQIKVWGNDEKLWNKEDKKKKYIDRMFILRQHLSGGALWSILRKLLKRKPEQNKMFVYESRFVDSKIVVSVVVPLYNTPQQYLRAMIESVLEQTYL